jgi:hypothetical protein
MREGNCGATSLVTLTITGVITLALPSLALLVSPQPQLPEDLVR